MRLVVTGDKFFLDRHRGLVSALSSHVTDLEIVPSGNLMELLPVRVGVGVTRGTPAQKKLSGYIALLDRRARGYELKSKQTEKKIGKLAVRPDFVLHIFSSFGPFWQEANIPYAMYLDFTMALAARHWTPWAAFSGDREYRSWLVVEKKSYEQATVLFTMGSNTKLSLVADYAIPEDKIRVVGSGGNVDSPYRGKKSFGTKRILFNGSEFERKGGDLLLTAFRLVRQEISEANLVIVGSNLPIEEPGVLNLGYIASREHIKELFVDSDLVVAPSRCDPFPGFVIEAMNYGVPCIVTEANGVSEVITNRIDGIIVDDQHPKALAEAIIHLLRNPATLEQISLQARNLVSNRLNWETVAASLAAGILEHTRKAGCAR